jgi:hypothetical protein
MDSALFVLYKSPDQKKNNQLPRKKKCSAANAISEALNPGKRVSNVRIITSLGPVL